MRVTCVSDIGPQERHRVKFGDESYHWLEIRTTRNLPIGCPTRLGVIPVKLAENNQLWPWAATKAGTRTPPHPQAIRK